MHQGSKATGHEDLDKANSVEVMTILSNGEVILFALCFHIMH